MNVDHPQQIKEYLQRQDVQERIQHSIQQARSNVTVTISKAADLFGFTESRLREWEKKGLLTADRNMLDGKEGHRRYATNELDKLAILQELIKIGGYSLSEIPPNLDFIWKHIDLAQQNHGSVQSDLAIPTEANPDLASKKPIDQRVKFAEQDIFWRYFVTQALRLSLMLICEDIPDVAGLILPLDKNAPFIQNPKEIHRVGESLIGWLSENRSFYTFLDSAPFFEEPTDFRIEALLMNDEDGTLEHAQLKNTMIVVQRKARNLNLSGELVKTVRRLLISIYRNIAEWKPVFGIGMRDYLYQSTDFAARPDIIDDTLNSLTDMIVDLGGKVTDSSVKNRWQFCCLLLAQDTSLPVQQRSLVVQAQSLNSPYQKLGNIVLSPENPGLSLRAYQSGTMIYRPDIPEKDSIIAFKDQEKENLSALALPIAREDGLSIGVLYVASETPNAFTVEDQRVLRLVGIMISELLLTYRARQGVAVKRSDLIDQPEIVDPAFQNFLTENGFIRDLETLLSSVVKADDSSFNPAREVSFIAIDIDNQSAFATRYGNRVARILSLEVGTRLQNHLKLFAKLNNKPLYHLNADRYYLFLDGMSLDDARKNAEQIRIALKDNYRVDAQRFSSKGTKLPSNMLEIPEVSVRLGVTSYTNQKLQEILRRYPSETTIAQVRELIMGSLDANLSAARREGGNIIVSWDPTIWGYAPWTPPISE